MGMEDAAPAVVQLGWGSGAEKLQPRPSEPSRVSSPSARDQIYSRDDLLVRRARVTFESLRRRLLSDRTDLHAAGLMLDRDLWLKRDIDRRSIVGPVPGISVGDVFLFRIELCILGLHGLPMGAIGYGPAAQCATDEPIATSIVVSDVCEDEDGDDRSNTPVYTSYGGHEYGHHALQRSMAFDINIRVIRAVKSKNSAADEIYFYDGLYKVVDFGLDHGKAAGSGGYKYKLLRVEGQEPMGSLNYRIAGQLKVDVPTLQPTGYLSFDISMGRESTPVALYNDVDNDRYPLMFEYLARPVFPSRVLQGKLAEGGGDGDECECIDNCSVGCHCAERNGGEFPYDKDGVLLQGRPLVYECGLYCHCLPSCHNRVSQKGLEYRLEVFRSGEARWGVRSLDLIKAGAFVCEFSGVVLTHEQSEMVSANNDCLVRPNRFPPRWLDWGDVSDVYPEHVAANHPAPAGLNFSVDVSRARNVAYYINHSCSPNVFAQLVLFDHYNVAYPHLMIFAMENIPPLRELCIDYGMV